MKKNKTIKSFISLLLLIFALFSCVDPFEIRYNFDQNILIVEAVLTDKKGEQKIILKYSTPSPVANNSLIFPFEKANVSILVNDTEKVQCVESNIDPGSYIAPASFFAEPNKTYRLSIISENGQSYRSDLQKLEPPQVIKKVYHTLKITGSEQNRSYIVNHAIYVDAEDPAGFGNNYLWDWKLYEIQQICKTCNPGEKFFYREYPPFGKCVQTPGTFLSSIVYDYNCDGKCWEIIRSTSINILNDEFVDGKTITARLVAELPIYQETGALFEVSQKSISKAAYHYYKILEDQTERTGTFADTPPNSLIGNIKNTDENSSESVVGYFHVAGLTTMKYWLDRKDLSGIKYKTIGLLGGRAKTFEPMPPNGLGATMAPCLNGYYRTNTEPEGWVNN
ncbi:MAG: DUF4249 family protein [Bacteroidota bacterium]